MDEKKTAAQESNAEERREETQFCPSAFLLKSQIHVVRGRPVNVNGVRYRWCLIAEDELK